MKLYSIGSFSCAHLTLIYAEHRPCPSLPLDGPVLLEVVASSLYLGSDTLISATTPSGSSGDTTSVVVLAPVNLEQSAVVSNLLARDWSTILASSMWLAVVRLLLAGSSRSEFISPRLSWASSTCYPSVLVCSYPLLKL